MEKIEPALTEGPLAQKIEYWRGLGDDAKRRGAAEEMHEYYGRMFGLQDAARSFGLTWKDVDDEEAELKGLEGQLRGWELRAQQQQVDTRNMEKLRDRIRRKRSRIQRIAALLPPRR